MDRWSWIWGAEGSVLKPVWAVVLACALTSCEGEDAGSVGPGGERDGRTALPAPAAGAGVSVTGMPTSPPPPRPVAPEVAAEPVAPVEPAAVADTGSEDPAEIPVSTEPAQGTAPATLPGEPGPGAGDDGSAPDPATAVRAVIEYMGALSSGAFARAQQQWASAPSDAAVLELARGPAFAADVGAAALDPSGRPLATVPVRVRGAAADGSPRGLSVTYVLQRGTGSTWRIVGASTRDGAP